MSNIPLGYCQCGCGQKTTIAKQTDPRYGSVLGCPCRFLHNHDKRKPIDHKLQDKYRNSLAVPFGYCYCGCGKQTSISKWADKRRETVKGQPYKFFHGHGRKIPDIERFWASVSKKETRECWIWIGSLNNARYGTTRWKSRPNLAHRVSWEIHYGYIPEGMCILHDCPNGDNKRCVNPNHLYLGTMKDNAIDRVTKKQHGIYTHPEYKNPSLTWDKIEEIRMLKDSFTTTQLGKMFNISRISAWGIVTNRHWKRPNPSYRHNSRVTLLSV